MRFLLIVIAAAIATQAQTFPSPNISLPKLIHRADSQYSKEALDAGLEGTVLLSVMVTTDGHASDIHVVRSLGKGLDEKAIECVEQWIFKPGTKDSEPVSMRVTVEINFRLPSK